MMLISKYPRDSKLYVFVGIATKQRDVNSEYENSDDKTASGENGDWKKKQREEKQRNFSYLIFTF